MTSDRGAQIIEKAKEMGAAIAGIASVEFLKKSPSHEILSKFGTEIDGVHSFEGMIEGFNEIKWPAKAKSALVIAFSHPQDKPELDWTYASGNTPGNRILQRINRELAAWIEETLYIKTHKMPGSTTLNRGRPKRGAQGASQPQIRGNGGAKSPYFV